MPDDKFLANMHLSARLLRPLPKDTESQRLLFPSPLPPSFPHAFYHFPLSGNSIFKAPLVTCGSSHSPLLPEENLSVFPYCCPLPSRDAPAMIIPTQQLVDCILISPEVSGRSRQMEAHKLQGFPFLPSFPPLHLRFFSCLCKVIPLQFPSDSRYLSAPSTIGHNFSRKRRAAPSPFAFLYIPQSPPRCFSKIFPFGMRGLTAP